MQLYVTKQVGIPDPNKYVRVEPTSIDCQGQTFLRDNVEYTIVSQSHCLLMIDPPLTTPFQYKDVIELITTRQKETTYAEQGVNTDKMDNSTFAWNQVKVESKPKAMIVSMSDIPLLRMSGVGIECEGTHYDFGSVSINPYQTEVRSDLKVNQHLYTKELTVGNDSIVLGDLTVQGTLYTKPPPKPVMRDIQGIPMDCEIVSWECHDKGTMLWIHATIHPLTLHHTITLCDINILDVWFQGYYTIEGYHIPIQRKETKDIRKIAIECEHDYLLRLLLLL